jgi:glycosyltransferase involved in cell wall biosynthesis
VHGHGGRCGTLLLPPLATFEVIVLSRPPVAVIVASRNRPEMLERCLRSVHRVLEAGDELVVVDSCSRPDVAERYAGLAEELDARLVRVERSGVNRARNLGWRGTQAPLLLFTDDDVEVEAGWADAFAACFDARDDVGFATGWLGAREEDESGHGVATVDRTTPVLLDARTRGTLGHGASMAVRRTALEGIGGWDDAMGAGGRFRSAPEVDVFDRLFQAGWLGWYEPAARARHEQWRTDRQLVLLHGRYALGMGARLAKLLRSDRRRCAQVTRDAWWDWGLKDALSHARHGRWKWVALAGWRMGAYAVGFLDAITTPVVDGHFRPRSEHEAPGPG